MKIEFSKQQLSPKLKKAAETYNKQGINAVIEPFDPHPLTPDYNEISNPLVPYNETTQDSYEAYESFLKKEMLETLGSLS